MRIGLLAAGASRRMRGADKLLESVDGMPLLRRQALAAVQAGVGPVAVTLPPQAQARRDALAGVPVDILEVADAAQGMSGSLRQLAHWAAGEPLMIAPADMPDLDATAFRTMADAFDGIPLRGSDSTGQPGHPVVLPPPLLSRVAGLTGDAGAKAILAGEKVGLVRLPGTCATTDLDTPEAWQEWRSARNHQRL
ncbi:MAG: nucleotidyltransferase family protein [Paracoccaceae bacterium]